MATRNAMAVVGPGAGAKLHVKRLQYTEHSAPKNLGRRVVNMVSCGDNKGLARAVFDPVHLALFRLQL